MMNGSPVVKLENVSKYYKLYNSPKERLKEALHPFRKKYHREFYALNGISLELKRGECLGIIGKNGMGKSTLLKIIANIIQPSSGTVQVNGTVSALLELGTGFNPEFTGMENIYFYGTILGFKKDEVERKVKSIVDFADIGEFIDQPVKTYSSGMFVRLAFAVQTSLKPDILLVDEVLSVGDIFFQQKCHARIEELLKNGTSIILVSHDTALIEKYAKKTILLDSGKCLFYGESYKAVQKYFSCSDDKNVFNKDLKLDDAGGDTNDSSGNEALTELSFINKADIIDPQKFNNIESFGMTEYAKLKSVFITDQNNQPASYFKVGAKANFNYEFILLKDIEIPVGGVQIRNSLNIFVHGRSTLQYSIPVYDFSEITPAGTVIKFRQEIGLSLCPGEYTVSLGLATISRDSYLDIMNKKLSSSDNDAKVLIHFPQVAKFSIIQSPIDLDFFGYVDLSGKYECELKFK